MAFKFIVFLTALFALFIGWIIYMADTGQESIFFDLVKITPYGDKVGHFFLFGLLTLGTNHVFKLRGITIGNITVQYGAMLIFSIVIIEELSQQFFPRRTFDLIDIIASLAGIIVFSMIPLSRIFKKLTNLMRVE